MEVYREEADKMFSCMAMADPILFRKLKNCWKVWSQFPLPIQSTLAQTDNFLSLKSKEYLSGRMFCADNDMQTAIEELAHWTGT